MIVSCIENSELSSQPERFKKGLKYFWTKWEQSVRTLMFSKTNIREAFVEEMLNEFLKATNKKEAFLHLICVAKINELVVAKVEHFFKVFIYVVFDLSNHFYLKKYDCAIGILKSIESVGFKKSRLCNDLSLFLNVSKLMFELNFNDVCVYKMSKKLKSHFEKMRQDCKEFFTYYKAFGMRRDIFSL